MLARNLPKVIGIVVLNLVLLASVFHWGSANLTNQSVSVALMVLLISLFSDLSEFDFWGLKGTREQDKIKAALEETKDQPAVEPNSELPAPGRKKGQDLEAAVMEPKYVATPTKTDLLEVSFALERLLRVAASRVTNGAIGPEVSLEKIIQLLKQREILTEAGVDQLTAIEAVRDLLIHGREEELNNQIIRTAYELAAGLYSGLYSLLYGNE